MIDQQQCKHRLIDRYEQFNFLDESVGISLCVYDLRKGTTLSAPPHQSCVNNRID